MKELILSKKYNNIKLNKFLKDNIYNISDPLIFKALRKKDIKINGKRITQNVYVFENDVVLVYISDNLLNKDINLYIVYEDKNILLINKPKNIEVTGNNSLTQIIHKKYSKCTFLPMPCHRLDRNTAGLIIFAKNKEALDILFNKFKNHEIEKHYLALVYGVPKVNFKKMEAYLFKDSKKSMVYISDTLKKGYTKIITSYKLIEKYPNNTSLLDVEIKTRKNSSNSCTSCLHWSSYYRRWKIWYK